MESFEIVSVKVARPSALLRWNGGDVISSIKRATRLPIAAFNVSGEYAMVKAAAAAGALDERAAVLEILTSLHRAGADVVVTYHAKDASRWIAEGS